MQPIPTEIWISLFLAFALIAIAGIVEIHYSNRNKRNGDEPKQ